MFNSVNLAETVGIFVNLNNFDEGKSIKKCNICSDCSCCKHGYD